MYPLLNILYAVRALYNEHRGGEYDECIMRRAARDQIVTRQEYVAIMEVITTPNS